MPPHREGQQRSGEGPGTNARHLHHPSTTAAEAAARQHGANSAHRSQEEAATCFLHLAACPPELCISVRTWNIWGMFFPLYK